MYSFIVIVLVCLSCVLLGFIVGRVLSQRNMSRDDYERQKWTGDDDHWLDS